MSMPARAPIAKAASVQAANGTPRRPNRLGASGIWPPAAKNGDFDHFPDLADEGRVTVVRNWGAFVAER